MVDTIDIPVPAPQPSPITTSAAWLNAIQPLVEQLELPSEVVTNALISTKLVKAANDKGAAALVDPDAITDEDFIRAFPDATSGDLRLAVKKLRVAGAPKPEPTPVVAPIAPTLVPPAVPGFTNFVIPDVPDGTNFLSALSVSKTLTVDDVSIRAALEALFADNLGLSEIPERLADMMEKYADGIEEPVGEMFMDVVKLVRERRYADVNVDSKFVTKARKQQVIGRLRELPAAMAQFHATLTAWNEQLKSNRASNPFGVLQGGANSMFPPPDEVIAAAEGVVACLKRAFSGFGVMVTKAMAYEGIKIRETLERPDLPALTGSPNREIMLKNMGVSLTRADERFEKNVARYVLFVATRVRDLPGGQEGPILEALWNLGQMVLPWMNGVTRIPTGNGRNGSSRGEPIPGSRDPERVRSGGLPLDDNGGSTGRYR